MDLNGAYYKVVSFVHSCFISIAYMHAFNVYQSESGEWSKKEINKINHVSHSMQYSNYINVNSKFPLL